MRAVAIVLILAGCFSPSPPEGLACDDGKCPPGQTCMAGVCRATGLPPDAAADADPDPCNGPTAGDPCDGDDDDECDEGTLVCNQAGDALECSDDTGSTVEVCDGASFDEDCDGASDEGFNVGTSCDGADTDMCPEGQWQCDGGGGAECDDTTGDAAEVCDGVMDEDCDGTFDEGFLLTEDELNCGSCGTVCQANNTITNMCITGDCNPICVAGAGDCDSDPANGCELRNTNPTCAIATSLGSVRGDDGTGGTVVVSDTGYSEAWYQVEILETVVGGGGDVEATVSLGVPTGVNYDLYVYCATCGGTLAGSSTNGAGATETVQIGNLEGAGSDTFTVYIEVRWISATACGDWSLSVTGNTNNGVDGC